MAASRMPPPFYATIRECQDAAMLRLAAMPLRRFAAADAQMFRDADGCADIDIDFDIY